MVPVGARNVATALESSSARCAAGEGARLWDLAIPWDPLPSPPPAEEPHMRTRRRGHEVRGRGWERAHNRDKVIRGNIILRLK